MARVLLLLIALGTFVASGQPYILQAPLIEVFTPTNGTVYTISDGVPAFEVSARASDADGVVTNVSLLLDGELLLSTNSAVVNYSQFATHAFNEGAHQLEIVAVDETGLRATSVVQFTTRQIPFFCPVQIQKESHGRIRVQSSCGRLQESDDLLNWHPIPDAQTGEYWLVPDQLKRFYRSVL